MFAVFEGLLLTSLFYSLLSFMFQPSMQRKNIQICFERFDMMPFQFTFNASINENIISKLNTIIS